MYYFHYQIGSKRDLKNNFKISKNRQKTFNGFKIIHSTYLTRSKIKKGFKKIFEFFLFSMC